MLSSACEEQDYWMHFPTDLLEISVNLDSIRKALSPIDFIKLKMTKPFITIQRDDKCNLNIVPLFFPRSRTIEGAFRSFSSSNLPSNILIY